MSENHRRRQATLILGLLLTCASSAPAQNPAAAAKVIVVQGRVSKLLSSEKWALFAADTIRVGEIIETGVDGYAQLQISDGSSFEVFPDSRVVFRANPGNLRDLVEVFLGKVKVYIQHYGGRPNNYRVHSPTAVISVRGTVFEVSVEPDTVTAVSVVEGLVAVEHRLLPTTKPVMVAPGEYLRVFPGAPLAQAGVNKAGVAAKVAAAVRDTLYSLPRRTGGRGPTGGAPGGGGTGGGVPTDTGAPPPPAPPSDQQAPPPPPPQQ